VRRFGIRNFGRHVRSRLLLSVRKEGEGTDPELPRFHGIDNRARRRILKERERQPADGEDAPKLPTTHEWTLRFGKPSHEDLLRVFDARLKEFRNASESLEAIGYITTEYDIEPRNQYERLP
jgi:hypothetical protein